MLVLAKDLQQICCPPDGEMRPSCWGDSLINWDQSQCRRKWAEQIVPDTLEHGGDWFPVFHVTGEKEKDS